MAERGSRDPDREIGEQLAAWGKVILLETRGRLSGRPVRTAVGFVEEPEGSLLVAAGDASADWARNLLADSHCTVTVGGQSGPYDAELLEGAQHSAAVSGLILRYGTPAERLGSGPAFRLRPVRSGET